MAWDGGGDVRPFACVRRFAGATALASLCVLGAVGLPAARAQTLDTTLASASPDAQLLLEADTLIYDHDRQIVTAAGNVQIDYDGNRMVAQRVIYNQRTGRLVAVGNVAMVEKGGNRIFADELDVTDDFRDGFLNALRIETVDKTYFAAESAERKGGLVTTFLNGVYTACEPCEEQPDKPPIWRIKSRRIVWNGQTKTVRFEKGTFEFFGLPLVSLPAFEIADPTVKRKSGFLFPGIGYDKYLGAKLSVPYFFALSPTYDLTTTGTYFSKQGFLGEVEWRQQLNSGGYMIHVAGIRQNDPLAFKAGTVDRTVSTRWMVGMRGEFEINPRWTFGWDVLVQSDKNFSRSYSLGGWDQGERRDVIYLTGFNDRNYFDLRFNRFSMQESSPDWRPNGLPNVGARNLLQPWVLPALDYSYTVDEPVAGGELSFGVNSHVIHRERLHFTAAVPALRGIDGTTGRVTAEAEWKRNIIMPGGLVVTPLLHARADGIGLDADGMTAATYGLQAAGISGLPYTHDGTAYGAVAADVRSSYYRTMATAGLELRWPVLFSTTSASHVLEPIAQILVRPDADHQSTLGIPNEDAQSLVFDASNLFEHDKFSGYDRIEGGSRANVGLRYSASFAGGWSASALFGQSYHLAGDNPFAQPDLVNVGAFSGLETDVSDFVGIAAVTTPGGTTLSIGARFDEKTFEARRTEAQLILPVEDGSFGASYTFIQAQPLYGFPNDRQEVAFKGIYDINENWGLLGSATYDLESEILADATIGFAYDDECFTYKMNFTRRQSINTREVDYTFGFNVSLRTIGDFGTSLGEFESTFGN